MALGASTPVLGFNPSSHDFGTIDFGSTASKTFTLTNSGGSATAALSVAFTAGSSSAFSKTADSCRGISLGPKKSCQVTVQYTPSAAGASDTATLRAVSKKPAATVSVALSGAGTSEANQSPSASLDSFSMSQNQAVASAITLGSVLSNDTDPDADPLSVVSVQNVFVDISNAGSAFGGMTAQLTNGDFSGGSPTITLTLNGQTATATLASDGTTSFNDPNNLFLALDSGEKVVVNASYTASDGDLTSSASVSITINGANESPSASNDAFSLSEDAAVASPLTLGNLLGNDPDPDGDALSVVSVQNVSLDTSNASSAFTGMTAVLTDSDFTDGSAQITLTLNAASATVTLGSDGTTSISDPNNIFAALDSGERVVVNASYTASDGDLTSSASVSITINGANEPT